ncbi:LysR family transcriptional regulator [Acidobacteria bacterium AB60]|nr:LysR family transcriptional regulator [Acidobacteria bacterium AB60]
MELRHLRYFVAAAEELNITQAAVRLNVSQPPLSRQIRDLEEEIGVALFERRGNKLKLTNAGARFLEEAKKILLHTSRAAHLAKATAAGQAGQLRIAFLSPLGGMFLPQVIRSLRKKFPLIDVDLLEMVPRRQLEGLLNNQVDLAFVAKVEVESASDFGFETVIEVGVQLALPPDHRLAARRKIPFAELAKERFITVRRSVAPATHDLFLRVCRSAGIEPIVVKQADRAQSILDLVAAGVGVALLPEHIRRYQTELVWRPVVPRPPHIPICMVWRKDDSSQALRIVRKMILQHFRRASQSSLTRKT